MNRPETIEARQVWALVGRMMGAVRRDPDGGFQGFDVPSAMALGAALQVSAVAIAELLPEVEAGFRAAVRDKRESEQEAAQ